MFKGSEMYIKLAEYSLNFPKNLNDYHPDLSILTMFSTNHTNI